MLESEFRSVVQLKSNSSRCTKFQTLVYSQKSTIPLTISPRRLERGNAWFYHKKGLLCDGISFDSESMLQIHPYDRILVRYDRSRCRLEFRNNFCFIGKIDGVIAADLRFCCFTDGDGCWTITSSALPSPSEKTLGFDCEQTGPKNSGDTDAGPKSYVVCQSTRDPRPTESPDNGLGFDVQDLSNRVSTCKLSDGDRTDRLLCEFFSDYGRGLERAVVTTNEVDAVENPAISKNSFTLRRCMTSSSRQSFPAAGELFLDCQPLKDCPVQILSSSSILDVCDIDSALLTIPIASDETSFAAKSKIQDLGYHESQLLCTNTMLVSKPDSLNGEIIL